MADYNFQLNDADFQAFLMNLQDGDVIRGGVMAGAIYLKGIFSEYPDDSNAHRPQPFKTDKQRRYFFYALRTGLIEVPYKRGSSPNSETMSKQFGVSERDGGETAAIGNRASYAPMLIGRKQAMYHKVTGWKDMLTMYNENTDNFGEQVKAGIKQASRKRG